ncbi:unnamed protein product [Hymenolepis diminuta]|uniref:Uncharacterized protein n=1 Tax=Hymenolepis diminuta TaxID=6216 RepID=A0A564ZCY8_HYMDI|nr:unnamed protein product [Hymenolepis diminuta]
MICTDDNPRSSNYATSVCTSGQFPRKANFNEGLIDEEFKQQLYDIFLRHLSNSRNPQHHVILNPVEKVPCSFSNISFENKIEFTGWIAFFLVYVPRAFKRGVLTYLQRTVIKVGDKSLDEFIDSLRNQYSDSIVNDPLFQPLYKEWETYFNSL